MVSTTSPCYGIREAHLVNLWQSLDFWTVKHTKRQADHLQVFGSSSGADVARLCPYIVDDTPLQPRNQEMCALVHYCLLHSGKSVEDDCAGTAFDIVHGGVGQRQADGGGHSPFVDSVEDIRGRHDR